MIIDSSALVAILRQEPEALAFAKAIDQAPSRRISAASFVEVAAVIDNRADPIASRRLDEFIHDVKIMIEPVTERQAHLARSAYKDFGKGSRHRACLNFGDCFAYALAKDKNEPLLFKGSDFTHTDIVRALP